MRITRISRATVLFSVCLLTSSVAAPEPPPATSDEASKPKKAMTEEERRMERVKADVVQRRALRQTLGDVPMVPARDGERGGVFQSKSSVPAGGPVTILLPDAPVELAAIAYARISGKEVLVSSRACYVPVSFEVNKAPAAEALAALEKVLNKAGVIVLAIDDYTVAFVLKPVTP